MFWMAPRIRARSAQSSVSLSPSFSLQRLNHHERNHDLASVALRDMTGQAANAIRRQRPLF